MVTKVKYADADLQHAHELFVEGLRVIAALNLAGLSPEQFAVNALVEFREGDSARTFNRTRDAFDAYIASADIAWAEEYNRRADEAFEEWAYESGLSPEVSNE